MPFTLRTISSSLLQGDPSARAPAPPDEEPAALGAHGDVFRRQEQQHASLRQSHMLDRNNVPGGACESPRSVLEPLVTAVRHAGSTASSCLGRLLCSPCRAVDEGCVWDEWDDGFPFRVLINTVKGAGETASMLSCPQSHHKNVSTLGCAQNEHETVSMLGHVQSQCIPDACYQSWQRQLSDSCQGTEDDEEFDMIQSIFSATSRRFLRPSESMDVKVRMISHESIFSAGSPGSSFCSSDASTEDFLKSCFLCNCTLAHDQDIYMYRGDRAFCSAECRDQQIFLDDGNETCFGAANWYSDL